MRLTAEKMMFGHIGIIHFIGIGGIGMSGIAEILHNLGYEVQGSDVARNYNIERLEKIGIKVFIGHQPSNIQGARVIVKSTAVSNDNPEIVAAKLLNLIIIKRSEMLAEIMRLKISVAIAGTHGKTTTTSLVASLFEAAGQNPTVINGGIINSHSTNAYLGSGDFLIAEADESDATFIKVPSMIGIITNIDPEHLDYYGSFAELRQAFKTFVENLPFYGFAVLCQDHPETAKLATEITDRTILTYGIESSDVNFRAVNIRCEIGFSDFDVVVTDQLTGDKRLITDVHLPIAGMHNVLNSLAAIAVGFQLDFPDKVITDGFKSFKGVKRRFTKTGEVEGIIIIDDYAHHPQEIIVTLQTAKIVTAKTGGRVIAVLQPHRYGRMHDLFSEFTHCLEGADIIIIADIYAAGEEPMPGINKDVLITAIKQRGYCQDVRALDTPDNLASIIHSIAHSGDLVLCMGAGSISTWANALPEQLRLLR